MVVGLGARHDYYGVKGDDGELSLCVTIFHLHSVDPRKLCIGVKYYIIHMYSMPYYTYGSTANFLVLEPTTFIYISKERRCDEDLHGIRKYNIE